ncbi:MAG TPA: ELWxxDGT repeat protein [Thermoanaerobaculia bacterium]|nr:ELWxxDGT repeat protein [Thermoanaerobaculia bacterium]
MARIPLPVLLASFLLPLAPLQAARPASLLADINTTEVPPSSGSVRIEGGLLPLGSRILFAASEPSSGSELWVSDGTDAGTMLLRDLCPNCSSNPRLLGRAGGVAIFRIRIEDPGAGFGTGFWRTDGTREGTAAFKTPALTECFGNEALLPPAEVGGVVVFAAQSPDAFCGLWRTDGTEAGTRRLTDAPFYRDHPVEEKPELAGGKLFFFTQEGLWRTDGTEAGTILLASLNPGGGDFFDYPRQITPVGSRVFFIAEGEGGGGEELWTSDGTAAGTRPVTQFAPEDPFNPGLTLKVFDGIVYFVADDVTGGADLWRSDGTAAGTRRVTDFGYASPFGSENVEELQLGKAGNRLVFPASDGITGLRIWTSGGTPAGTAPLEGCPGGCPTIDHGTTLVTLGSRVLFTGFDLVAGTELWSTDGTAAGTRRVLDDCPGLCSSQPSDFVHALGRLFFLSGSILWATDGTPQGTVRLADLELQLFSPLTAPLTPVTVAGRIYFAAGDEFRIGRQLWTSDGTPEGTGLVTLIGRNGPGSFPFELTAFGNDLLFFAFDGQARSLWSTRGTAASTAPLRSTSLNDDIFSFASLNDLTLSGGLAFFLRGDAPRQDVRVWRTDGTEDGTFPVSPTGLTNLENLVAFRGKAVFTTYEPFPAISTSFWESDGTVAGTRQIFDLEARFARGLRAFGSDLYFLANTGESFDNEQVWATDGTAAGTRKLTDFQGQAFDDRQPPEMVKVESRVFFATLGRLWATDGTAAGTYPILLPGVEAAGPASLVEFQGHLYFIGQTQQAPFGRGLWRSDGTGPGTVLVKPVAPPFDFSRPEPAWLTVAGPHLFFSAYDSEHGLELWRTDGTPEGTVLVRDISPGTAWSFPRGLAAAGSRLFFRATNGSHGFELWESDGTPAGTRMVQDVAPGGLSSYPEELTEAGGRLYFRADDGVSGSELWSVPLASPPGCQTSGGSLCLGGRFQVEATWRDFQGNIGRGHAVSLTGDTGYFWFFDPANVEVILKVLDGQGLNGHHWVFYGALSTVEYTLTVTDVQTGASRRYINPSGRLGSVGDTIAFGPKGATGAQRTLGPAAVEHEPIARIRKAAAAPCVPSATRLCLQGGRFAVEADWRDFQGKRGKGTAVPLPGGDTGYFWFFEAENVEVVLKVLDGRPLNGKFWVFYGALSSVQYTLTVTDTETGQVKKYENPSGRLGSVADTGAF